MKELQQTLIKDDCYIPGIKAVDKDDLVSNKASEITASSFIKAAPPTNINGDYARHVEENVAGWISDKMSENGEWLKVSFDEEIAVKNIILRFDPDFKTTMIPTQSYKTKKRQEAEMPYVLVRDYELIFEKNGKIVKTIETLDNFQRVNKFEFSEKIVCDNVKIVVKNTYGDESARIFDFRIYE